MIRYKNTTFPDSFKSMSYEEFEKLYKGKIDVASAAAALGIKKTRKPKAKKEEE